MFCTTAGLQCIAGVCTPCARGDKCSSSFNAASINEANRALVLREYCQCAVDYRRCFVDNNMTFADEAARLCSSNGDFAVYGCNDVCALVTTPSPSMANEFGVNLSIVVALLAFSQYLLALH